MNTNNTIILDFIERMVKDGYSKSRISKLKGLMNKLSNYMADNDIDIVSEELISSFVIDTYSFDYFNPTNDNQLNKVKYLKNLLEFKNTGNYLKCHSKQKIKINNFYEVYNKYEKYLNTRDITDITKKCKLIKTKLFLNSLDEIDDISKLEKNHCYNFINNLDCSLRYKEEITYEVRRIIDWLYDNNLITFDGYSLFPRIIGQSRSNIISYYDNEDIEKLLNSVNINTSIGKRDYLILSLIVYLGLRISDVINLKLGNINWVLNTINIVQQKTNRTLTLPLIDQVKFPLLDYLKSVRKDVDSDYVF